MSELRVASFGEAQALANKFNVASGNLQELIAFCETVGGDLQGIWEGASVEAFLGDLEEVKMALNKMVGPLSEMTIIANARLEALAAANQ